SPGIASRGRDTPGLLSSERRHDKAVTPRAVPTTAYFCCWLGREADAGRAYDAALLHRRLLIIGGEPRAGLCHVGYILQDHDIIRIFGAAEHSSIRDACRQAAALASIVTCTPCGVVLDLEVDGQVFVRLLCIHRDSSEKGCE